MAPGEVREVLPALGRMCLLDGSVGWVLALRLGAILLTRCVELWFICGDGECQPSD